MVHIKVNHTFLGGNNPRIEIEEIKGKQGDGYKIRNRSNVAYSIRDSDKELLNGIFNDDIEITINYDSKAPSVPSAVYLEPDSIELYVGETIELKCRFEPEGDYQADIQYKLVENANVASINGNRITGQEIGFGLIQVTATGDGFSLENNGSVIVSGRDGG